MNQATQGRRETAKQARRQALLDVARTILADGDLSMRQLAQRAGVAHATPYNLFGSKRDLIAALYVDQRERLEARLAADAGDPLARLFDAVGLIAEDLDARPHFHRALHRAVYRGESDPPPDRDDADPGVHFWMGLVAAAEAAGGFRAGARVDLYARSLMNMIVGSMLDWSEGRIDAHGWGVCTRYGIALLTLPIVAEDARAMVAGILDSDPMRSG
ncbi:TetR/AcrR family transcriptional regulator [Sphingomonas jatrophae]|uniref:Transcriptional regulator, TetR family n=1 Tax=Sphingomonas jatrophae TaxID=1166337 RepID=A0A1I6KEL8_9SPHN|nr:TetR/AcrR family transcriptional regulator [Sphingomonas jatrophae]SFR89594.1 transcriptional regulator, TetR family [Sphingomonas jatrophae]